MKPADVHKFIRLNRRKLVKLFSLQHFTIELKCEKIDGETRGTILFNNAYRKIHLRLDPSKITNDKDLWWVVRHEFLHTLLQPFEQLEDFLGDVQLDERHKKVINAAFLMACEQTVFNLERFEPIKRLEPPAK